MTNLFRRSAFLACFALLASLMVWKLALPGHSQTAAPPKPPAPPMDEAALNVEVVRLKTIMPTQSHVMADVALQASNLWFAGQKKNWPLATYFLGETRNRIRWMIRIDPMAKEPGGVTDLQGIYDGIDNNIMGAVKQALDNKDSTQFVAAYKHMLEGCYACHKSAGRPYLRPAIPTSPPLSIIDFDPNAKWPE